MKKKHRIVRDGVGWGGWSRLTCHACNATCLRAPWMSAEDWRQRVLKFEAEHK